MGTYNPLIIGVITITLVTTSTYPLRGAAARTFTERRKLFDGEALQFSMALEALQEACHLEHNEKNGPGGWLGFLLGMRFPTQLYGDFEKP